MKISVTPRFCNAYASGGRPLISDERRGYELLTGRGAVDEPPHNERAGPTAAAVRGHAFAIRLDRVEREPDSGRCLRGAGIIAAAVRELKRHGIGPRVRVVTRSLLVLTGRLPSSILAERIGIHKRTGSGKWVRLVGSSCSYYVALRQRQTSTLGRFGAEQLSAADPTRSAMSNGWGAHASALMPPSARNSGPRLFAC